MSHLQCGFLQFISCDRGKVSDSPSFLTMIIFLLLVVSSIKTIFNGLDTFYLNLVATTSFNYQQYFYNLIRDLDREPVKFIESKTGINLQFDREYTEVLNGFLWRNSGAVCSTMHEEKSWRCKKMSNSFLICIKLLIKTK